MHYRDGTPVGIADHAVTMYSARYNARARQEDLHSSVAIIVGKTDRGDKKEIEVIEFAR